jgi:hypothetical protein
MSIAARDYFVARRSYSTDWEGMQAAIGDFFREKYGDIIADDGDNYPGVEVFRSEYEVCVTVRLRHNCVAKELPDEFMDCGDVLEAANNDDVIDMFNIMWEETLPFISEMLGKEIIKVLTTEELVYCITGEAA